MEKRNAFFYENNYYLLPENCKFADFEKSLKKSNEGEFEKLVQKKCLAPNFVKEEIQKEKLVIDGLVYPAQVVLFSRKEYNDKLREIVKKHCGGCPNFSSVDETDKSLEGHHEEISLDDVCFVREASENEFEGDFVNYNDRINGFCEEFKDNTKLCEELLDKKKEKNVRIFLINIFSEWLGIRYLKFFVGKHKNGKYYFYCTSLFDQRLALILRSFFYKLNKMEMAETWDMKDYIPEGFIPKEAIKPKCVDFEVLDFEHKYIKITLPGKNEEKAMNMVLWLMGTLGEDRFKSVCEGFELLPKIYDSRKAEVLIEEMNKIIDELPKSLIAVPPTVIMLKMHDNGNLVGVRTYCSSEIMQFMDDEENGERSDEFWDTHYLTNENEFPLFKATFFLKDKLDLNQVDKLYEDKNVDPILQTSKYLMNNLSGIMAGFEVCEDKVFIFGLAYSLPELKRSFSYLSPICENYNATLEIFTHSGEIGGKFLANYEMKKLEDEKN